MKTKNNKDKITLSIKDKNIEASIKYPKHSRLKTRLKVLDKLREELYIA